MDQETTRTIQELEKQSINRDKKIDEASNQRYQLLESAINELIKQQNLTGQISTLQQQKEILAHLYDKASAYTNLIILGGYAGMFGIWQIMKGVLTTNESILIGCLIAISIMLFAAFEIYKMVSQTLFLTKLDKIAQSNFAEKDRLSAWQLGFIEYQIIQQRVWIWFLIPTVLSGFGAGFVLLWLFTRNI